MTTITNSHGVNKLHHYMLILVIMVSSTDLFKHTELQNINTANASSPTGGGGSPAARGSQSLTSNVVIAPPRRRTIQSSTPLSMIFLSKSERFFSCPQNGCLNILLQCSHHCHGDNVGAIAEMRNGATFLEGISETLERES